MFHKQKNVHALVTEQIKDVKKCLVLFESFIRAATVPDTSAETLQVLRDRVCKAEDAADISLRAMIDSLSDGSYLPSTKESIISIGTSCDKVANKCEYVANLVVIYGFKFPPEFSTDFNEIYDIIEAQFECLETAIAGHHNIGKLSSIATNNEAVASPEDVESAVNDGTLSTLRLKSALKAFIIFACAGITVFIMSFLKFPVSANQSITGAVIGWGLCYADYSNPVILQGNLAEILEFMSTWLINPLGAAVISFVLVLVAKKALEKRLTSMQHYDAIITIGYIAAGAFSAYSIGQNSSASVTAFYYDATGLGANILTDARITAIIGGIAIALGVLTFSKRVMMTVGSSIAGISQIDGFVVIIASALTVILWVSPFPPPNLW